LREPPQPLTFAGSKILDRKDGFSVEWVSK
jgi:hypothetical protein